MALNPASRVARVADAVVSAGRVDVTLSGDWQLADGLQRAERVNGLVAADGIRQLGFRDAGLRGWDSTLLTFVLDLKSACTARGIAFDPSGLPDGVRRLVELATAVPERTGTRQGGGADSFVASVGKWAIAEWKTAGRAVKFLGESTIGFLAFLSGRARYRRIDLWLAIQECGAQALPIVTVISLLIGMILAFVGAVQLKQFGADIYVANLVAVAMVREMAAVMTGIVLAGRTGAAFAAQIGTMQGNEEIDALSTLGISPIEFLVLPRMLALIVMMPLLCLYANLMGIIGGFIVAVGMLNVTATAYLLQTQGAIGLTDIAIGVVKSAVFGVLIAITGCLRGMEAGRSAAAVGEATTGAVVSGILYIIVADARLRRPAQRAGHLDGERRGTPHRGARPRHGLRRLRRAEEHQPQDRAGRDLRDHGRQRLRQEHAAAPHDRPGPARARRGLLRRRRLLGRGPGDAGGDAAALRRAVPDRRAVELDDARRERGAAAAAVHEAQRSPRSPRSWRSSWPWSGCTASRTTTRRRSAAACGSAPAWRARWRSIPTSCSSTSRRPASIRSARGGSTT